uniref:GON-4-like protein n=1 Tax=Periophthalmus magnuspinnatus TaxID=409849 RepID=A0A3B4A1J6_9GOBI
TSGDTSGHTSGEDSHGSENQLELDLCRMSRKHNLTKRNVQNILREVITHERVVDMMRAAIRDTQDLPLFEPKITRSRLKQAVEQGQVNLAIIKLCPGSGFVDMDLEEEEDSSDEEYCPDEDEEDDTTDEVSGYRYTCCTMVVTLYYRLDRLASRTRSKLPLVDVPINRLEAELLAPDITADMYASPSHQTQDPHWTQWLQGLLAPENTEEAEDEDDPEYNFLEDLDEPDLEDYRTDRAVQITSMAFLWHSFPIEAPLWGVVHVQLLTQIHLLTKGIQALNHEADVTKNFLVKVYATVNIYSYSCSLLKTNECTNANSCLCPGHAFPLLPAQLAWVFATRPVFLYPELLPVCSLDPALHPCHKRQVYTQGEDGLIVLGMKHFEGSVKPDQLITDFLVCKTRSNFTKHIREMSSKRALPNIIKSFLASGGVPPLPLACAPVDPSELCPPVDRYCNHCPNWLKNSRETIQKTRLSPSPPRYPYYLPVGCTLRLHPHWLPKCRPPLSRPKRRLFTLAHNRTLKPLAKRYGTPEQSIVTTLQQEHNTTQHNTGEDEVQKSPCPTPFSGDLTQDQGQAGATAFILSPSPSVLLNCETDAQTCTLIPPLLPMSSNIRPLTVPLVQPLIRAPPSTCPHTLPILGTTSPVKLSPQLCTGVVLFHTILEPTPNLSAVQQNNKDESNCVSDKEIIIKKESIKYIHLLDNLGGGDCEENEDQSSDDSNGANEGQRPGEGGTSEGGGAKEGQGPGEGEEANEGQKPDEGGGGPGDGPGEGGGGGDEGGDEDEEEEEFDDLTQDEDEEEVMSSASEESVLSVPELQETMKQLTWLAAERRLGDADSEEDLSQEDEEEEEEEDGPTKGEESKEERGHETRGDEERTAGEEATRGASRGPSRGRGRSRPPRGLKRSRQDRMSKDASKLLLLYDENILEKDPQRESKDTAFAQGYLNRVYEALQDTPMKMEQFVTLLGEFEKVGEMPDVVSLFHRLQCILGHRTDLLRDFAAFLQPEQALECGLFEEQQAFDRSRRFLRQLEISFGDNPSHYQKIIKALQMGPDVSPTSVNELKSQMTSLLKGHTHLQSELWVFFDELHPPPAQPGHFEEAQWPEEAEGREGGGVGSGHTSGFEEVTLPELDEEEDRPKIQPMTVRQQRRKMVYKCDWSGKSWMCLCHDANSRKPGKKACPRCKVGCYGNYMLTADIVASWEGPFLLHVEDNEDKDETDRELSEKRQREQGTPLTDDVTDSSPSVAPPSSDYSPGQPCVSPPHTDLNVTVPPSPSQELTVCAKNISLTASGEKVILWTRDADRVILTRCQQEGANPCTFQQISTVLGNKTPSQVSQRFQDLMRLFHTTARHTSSEDEVPSTEAAPKHGED